MAIYQDTRLPIVQVHCTDCKESGDLLDLTAKVFDTTRELALYKVQELSPAIAKVFKDNADNIEKNRQVAAKAMAAWHYFKDSRSSFNAANSANTILKHIETEIRPTVGWTDSCLSKILGTGYAEEVEAWLTLRNPKDLVQKLTPSQFRQIPKSVENVIVVPLYLMPGVIEGFQLHYVLADKLRSRVVWFPYIGNEVRSAIAGDPEILFDKRELLIVETPQILLKMQLDALARSKNPIPVVAISGEANECCSVNLQLLAKRKCTVWTYRRRPHLIQLAAHLNSSVSDYGSEIINRLAWMTRVGPHTIMDRIKVREFTWPSFTAGYVQDIGVTKAIDFIQNCQLNNAELMQITDKIRDENRDVYTQAFQPTWPYKRIPANAGCLEQRSTGWYYLRGTGETLVTDAPFRILQIHGVKNNYSFLVEVSFNHEKRTFSFPKDEFIKKPMLMIQNKLMELQVGLTNFHRSWEPQAIYVSQQLYPCVNVAKTKPIGVDISSNEYRCTQVSLDLNTGAIRKMETQVNGSLLPLASGDSQKSQTIVDLAKDDFTRTALLSMLYQTICEIRGVNQPLVVLTDDSQNVAGRKFLKQIGIIQPDTHTYASNYRIVQFVTDTSSMRELPDYCRWLTCSRYASLYYGGYRNIIDMPITNRVFEYADADLQNLLLKMVMVYVRHFTDELDSLKAVNRVWQHVYYAVHKHRKYGDNLLKVRKPDRTICELINEGLMCELWKFLSERNTRPELYDLWYEPNGRLTFTRESINSTLAYWGLPRWEMGGILAGLMESPIFKQSRQIGRRQCWQISPELISLSPKVRHVNSVG